MLEWLSRTCRGGGRRTYDVLYEEFGLSEIDPTGGRTAINLYGPPGAVLFFDEADSILGRRLNNIAQSTDHAPYGVCEKTLRSTSTGSVPPISQLSTRRIRRGGGCRRLDTSTRLKRGWGRRRLSSTWSTASRPAR